MNCFPPTAVFGLKGFESHVKLGMLCVSTLGCEQGHTEQRSREGHKAI